MFSSLFSSQAKESVHQKSILSSGVITHMKSFAGKVSLILGLAATSNVAISAPSVPDIPSHNQEISTSNKASTLQNNSSQEVLLPNGFVSSEQKKDGMEPVSVVPKLRMATAKKGDSVGSFMYDNFGTIHGWELLVEKEMGKRVQNPNKDLIAGKTYILARSEKEANILSSIAQKQSLKKDTLQEVLPLAEKTVEKIVSKIPMAYNHFAASEASFYSIAQKVGLPKSQILNVIALASTIGHHESSTRYNAHGITINNKKSVHYNTKAEGRYQIMNQNKLNWSMKHFGTALPSTPENQDKIAFAQIAERFSAYNNAGLGLSSIVKEIAADWYGRGRAMPGQPTTAQYSNAISHLYSKISYNFAPKFATASTFEETSVLRNATLTEKAPISHKHKAQTVIGTRTSSDEEKPKIMLTTVSANDARFDEAKEETPVRLASVDGRKTEEKVLYTEKSSTSAPPQYIEFIPVADDVENVIQSREQEYKMEVMERIQNDTTTKEDVRKRVLAVLAETTSLHTLCRNNIKKYEADKLLGTAEQITEAEEILPKLYILLSRIENKVKDHIAQNNSNIPIPMKRAA